jgi:hypothetical protein
VSYGLVELALRASARGGALDPRTTSRVEMPLCECPARAGLQVTLEAQGGLLVRELDGYVYRPRTIAGGVRAPAGVVICEPS